MDQPILRLLIQQKLTDGRLPQERHPTMWGGQGAGETCDACAETVTETQMLIEAQDLDARGCVQLHVACFQVWDVERQCLSPATPMSESCLA
jgi:hypothetical protein